LESRSEVNEVGETNDALFANPQSLLEDEIWLFHLLERLV
jgi:hypothetical protein